ncbi:MAG: M23 family metallopeptidase, partial [Myxococcota bacterium]
LPSKERKRSATLAIGFKQHYKGHFPIQRSPLLFVHWKSQSGTFRQWFSHAAFQPQHHERARAFDRLRFFNQHGEGLTRRPQWNAPLKKLHITSHYGMRIHPILRRRKMHRGTDFKSRCGQPIYAIDKGKVITRRYSGGAGRMITLQHRAGWKSRYFHLQGYAVRRGQHVNPSQLIGYVGSSGLSSGCHLHFEMLRHNKHVNPARFLFRKKVKLLACKARRLIRKLQRKTCRQLGLSRKACRLPQMRCADT